MAKTVVIQPPPNNFINQPSADFIQSNFDVLIHQKGYRVVIEKSLQCPCKSPNTNQLSNCKNCGGTGWAFINPVLTRVVLSSMNFNTGFKAWSEENAGTVNLSVRDVDRISYMDKITVLDATSTFTETRPVTLDETGSLLFCYTSYNIKSIDYIAFFVDTNTPYQRLFLNQDYTFKANVIYFDTKFIARYNQLIADNDSLSFVVRYSHPPQYFVVDISRDIMKSWARQNKKEALLDMPLAAIAKRAHLVIDAENLSKTRLLDNSYVIDPCLKDIKEVEDLFNICR